MECYFHIMLYAICYLSGRIAYTRPNIITGRKKYTNNIHTLFTYLYVRIYICVSIYNYINQLLQ